MIPREKDMEIKDYGQVIPMICNGLGKITIFLRNG